MADFFVSDEDKLILRELAKKQLELANKPENVKRVEEWTLHNDLKGQRPMIHLEMGTFAHEILPQRVKCKGPFAREIEESIYCNFLNQELFDDDRVTPDCFPVGYHTYFKPFGIDIKVVRATDSNGENSVGHQFEHIINDLEEDYGKLKKSEYGVDIEKSLARKSAIEEIIGDILPVKLVGSALYSVPTQNIVHIMGMENMLYNICDYPDLFKEMMSRLADDTLAFFHFLEDNNALLPTTGCGGLSQGSFCYNDTLPKQGNIALKDVWGFMDSQETVSISPQMYEEFIFPTYKRVSEVFGLFSYGCCEPVHPIWDSCLSKLENLRKVSISPWCDEEFMGQRLRGSNTIFHRKPSPNFLGVGEKLDEEEFRGHIRKSILAAKGCKMEIAQRDVYTINHDVAKAKRYVDIIKEEIVNNW